MRGGVLAMEDGRVTSIFFYPSYYATNASLTALICARVVIPHTLAYASITADVHRGVSCGEFRENLHDDFEVQRQRFLVQLAEHGTHFLEHAAAHQAGRP